jgi:hypothetical protein
MAWNATAGGRKQRLSIRVSHHHADGKQFGSLNACAGRIRP